MRSLSDRHVVVCVDDEPAVLAALRRSLRNEPYQVLTTSRPEEALQWVGTLDVSLVVSDQRMPERLGTDLLGDVLLRSPGTSRVILTAYAGGTAKIPGLRQTVDCMISKPWDTQMLKGTIRELLRHRELTEYDEAASLRKP